MVTPDKSFGDHMLQINLDGNGELQNIGISFHKWLGKCLYRYIFKNLTGESEAGGDSRHGGEGKLVQVTVGEDFELQDMWNWTTNKQTDRRIDIQMDGQLNHPNLTGESEAGGDTRHGGGNQMVQVTVGGGGELQGSEADVVQGLVVNAVGLVGVLNQLMDGQGGVVGLDNGVRHLKEK